VICLDKKTNIISIVLSIFIVIVAVMLSCVIRNNMKKKIMVKTSMLGSFEKETSKELKDIIYENQKLVVCIEVETSEGKFIGSGFLYNDKGDIVTNAHVVQENSSVKVKMSDTTTYSGVVIGKSNTTDVALIRVEKLKGKKPMRVDKSKKYEIGDEIIALGSPLGLQNSATTGIISGVDRDFNIENYQYKGMYQISAPISEGNSGGPLIDRKTGQVIGINSAKLGEETIGFSIPIHKVVELLDNWSNNPSVTPEDTPTENFNESLIKEDGEYLVDYFYHTIASKDFVEAYSMLSSNWQNKMPYETFSKGYDNTLSVKIDSMTSRKITNNQVEVIAIIEATERINGNNKLNKYKTTYKVGIEENKLKILEGQAKVLN
jgi:serine protease Do